MPRGWRPLTDHRSTAGALLLALAAVLALPASGQVLYKLIDRQGRVTYADREPRKFDGTVIRLESDPESNVMASPKIRDGVPAEDAVPGLAERRRRIREDLDGRLRAAQALVEAAKRALEEGRHLRPDDLQTIQHRHPPLKSGQVARNPNCFAATDASGAASLNCPSRVPQEAYYERQRKLEEDLKRAEEALAVAERAYRRGTD